MKAPFLGERYRQIQIAKNVATWPLHIKMAGKIDLSKVTAAAQQTRYAESWARVTGAFAEEMYRGLRKNKPAKCVLSVDDVQTVLRTGLFERIARKDVRQWAKMWALPEAKKQRRRLILWPSTVNARWRPVSKQYGSEIVDCLEHMDIERYFVPLDMSAAFFQIEMPPAIRRYYAVHTAVGPICITRLPMGVSFAPELLQLLLKIAVSTDKPVSEHSLDLTAVHIDNVLLSSTHQPSVDAAVVRLKTTLQQWGGTIDVDRDAIISDSRGLFCGAEFDTKRHVFRVKQSSVAKLLHPAQVTTIASHRENVSRLLYASRILRLPMADYYYILKWTRRLYSSIANGKVQVDEKLPRLWDTARSEYQAWHKRVAENEWTSHPKATEQARAKTVFLMTDASLEGWGAVLVKPGQEPQVFKGVWEKRHAPKEMTTLEMRALRMALRVAQPHIAQARNLALVADNTAVKAVLRKGAAHSCSLNRELATVIGLMPRKALIYAYYVPTDVMPADEPSRGRPLDRAKLKTALDSLQLRLGPSGVPEGRTRDRVSRVRYAGKAP